MKHGLCYRCEFRAQFLEKGHAPRCQCGDVGNSYASCYQYQPVRPVMLRRKSGDPRPMGAPAFIAPRMERAGLADMELRARMEDDGTMVAYWGFPSNAENRERKENE